MQVLNLPKAHPRIAAGGGIEAEPGSWLPRAFTGGDKHSSELAQAMTTSGYGKIGTFVVEILSPRSGFG
jgi:hypothetical protein